MVGDNDDLTMELILDDDVDLNMLPPVTDLLQVHRHFGRVHRPVQSHRSLISSLYILSISSSATPSLSISSFYIVLCSAITLLYSLVNLSQSLITVYV